jgi:hypothetical protein
MSASGGSRGVLYVIVCAAPAAASVGELVELAQDAVPLVKEALARHVAFGRSREVLNEMGVRVLFDPQAPPQSRMPSWPTVLEELHTVTGYRPGRRD